MVNPKEEKFQQAYDRHSTFFSKNFQTLPRKQTITANTVHASQTKYDETSEGFGRTCQYKCCI